MSKIKLLTTYEIDQINEWLEYDSKSGLIWWKKDRKYNSKKGFLAGQKKKGYHVIKLNRKDYFGHRIAWILFYGKDLKTGFCIDHINGIRDDNRIENLKWMSIKENARYADINGRLVHGEKSGMSKLNKDLIEFIFKCKSENMDNRRISKIIGVNERTVGYVVNGGTWIREAKQAIKELDLK